MTRLSDTRQRTREAAAQLVAGGKRPHEITVDLIYAAIQQGSRTTINDELKQWKDERTKADALGGDLPGSVADAMRSLWVAAVEQGEALFAEQRAALEACVTEVTQHRDASVAAHEEALTVVATLTAQKEALQAQFAALQTRLDAEACAKEQALESARTLQEKWIALQADTADQLERMRREHTQKAEEFQAAIISRDAAFEAEREKANQRIETAQARMLQETDAAREAQRRAEGQLTKVRERIEQQQTELAELRLEAGRFRRERAELDTELAQLTVALTERDRLVIDLAVARGQLEGMGNAMHSLEARAATAEARLAVVASTKASGSRSKRAHSQDERP